MNFSKTLKTIRAFRGESLTIDLGKEFEGTLMAWMKKSADSATYRSFDIEGNRFLKLPVDKTKDYYNEAGVLLEGVAGKWLFDVEFTPAGGNAEDKETVYTGVILFSNDITNSEGVQLSDDRVNVDNLEITSTYQSIDVATAALGSGRLFKYDEDNLDGVPSPSSSSFGITKNI